MSAWPTWGCEASKFPWSYSENETCYVLEGRVIVTPDGEGLIAVIEQTHMCACAAGRQARKTLSQARVSDGNNKAGCTSSAVDARVDDADNGATPHAAWLLPGRRW